MRVIDRVESDRIYCSGCPLRTAGAHTWYVPTEVVGSSVTAVFVGESPGETEDLEGKPFAGGPGKLLRAVAAEAGFTKNVAFANVCRCRPPDDRAPTDIEVSYCYKYLLEDIQKLQPKVVICMGATAINTLMQDLTGQGVIKSRGKHFEYNGIKYIATVHPSYVFRKQGDAFNKERRRFLLDLEAAKALEAGKRVSASSKKGKAVLIETLEDLKNLVTSVLTTPALGSMVGLDTEAIGLNRYHNRLRTIQISNDGVTGYVIPYQDLEAPWNKEELEQVKHELIRLFTTETKAFRWWVGHHLKTEVSMLRTCVHPDIGTQRLPFNAKFMDCMNLAFAIDEERIKRMPKGALTLSTLSEEFLGFLEYAESGMKEKRDDFSEEAMPLRTPEFIEYGAMDAYVPHRLARALLKAAGKGYCGTLLRMNDALFSGLTTTFETIERNGFYVNKPHLALLVSKESPIKTRIYDIIEEIHATKEAQEANELMYKKNKDFGDMPALFGTPWTFDITKKTSQLALYIDILGLEPKSYGKAKTDSNTGAEVRGEPSIDAEFLIYHGSNEDSGRKGVYLVDLLSELKALKKLDESYTTSVWDFLENSSECRDGRVHTHIHTTRARSGRTSCSDPNTQQTPRKKGRIKATNDVRKAVKSMYCVPYGRLLVQMDVRQSEVRWLAQIANDTQYAQVFWNMLELRKEFQKNPTPEMAKRVQSECDVHRQVAAMMHRILIDQVTDAQRQGAKAITFGLIFGQHVKTLAKNLGISVTEAQGLFDQFFRMFPASSQWLRDIEIFAQRYGFVESPFGRRRHLAEAYESGDKYIISKANRQARNSPPQGASSDCNLLAGIRLQNYIEEHGYDWKMVGMVHDSIITEIPFNYEECKFFLAQSEKIFVDPEPLKAFGINMILPLEVEYEIGFAYGDLEDWDEGKNPLKSIWGRLQEKVEAGTAWPLAA